MIAEIFGVDGIIVLAVVLVVLFGGAQIPRFARSLGSAHKEFKAGQTEPTAPLTTSAPAATATPVMKVDEVATPVVVVRDVHASS